jgi:Ca2+-transporting ATPase
VIAAQFTSIIVLLLLVASWVAFVLGDLVEGTAILFVIVVNSAIGFFMEWRAERALEALKKQVVPTAVVIRDGKEQRIASVDLVPGDLVILSAGDRIAADGRVIEAVRLHTIEAALTGESLPVAKVVEALTESQVAVADRINMVFKGTAVADGRGKMIVTSTGSSTELGKIGKLLGEIVQEKTPLERKLRHLGNMMVVVVLGLCTLVTVAGWYRGNDFLQMLEVGISLAIAAVPEGLPAVATMALALGMKRMANMRTVIRRLPAVETLGATTVVCTDKTGTLTKNEMTVCVLQLCRRRIEVTGSGYSAGGNFIENGNEISPEGDEQLSLALRIGALCNDAGFGDRTMDGDVYGDPTEVALLVAARKGGLHQSNLSRDYPRIREVPFSSESKRMATFHRMRQGSLLVAVKGAVGVVLDACTSVLTDAGAAPLSEGHRTEILNWNHELASKALRVLALAFREVDDTSDSTDVDSALTFVALVGMSDSLRDEAESAVALCREAGIRVVMITGDQIATASVIGSQLGIMKGETGEPLRAIHGRDLSTDFNGAVAQEFSDVAVFARVSPEHKLRIVECFQANGDVVAMTGDGVNDAPALKKADIGIAMGIKGSEVAKDASDMVITDDNFATIVHAIEQGRIIYANIIRFVHYLFSCNLAEIVIIFSAILLGWPLPLAAIQLLWLNMVTDIFPALALVLEPSSPGMMRRPPRRPDEPIISGAFAQLIIFHALLLGAATLVAFRLGLDMAGGGNQRVAVGMTMAFTTLAFTQIFHALSARSQHRSIFAQRLSSNYWLVAAVVFSVALQLAAVYIRPLQRVLHTAALGRMEMLVVLVCAAVPVVIVELIKRFQVQAAVAQEVRS